MEKFNQKGTCKCVDYFRKGKGLYIKQKKYRFQFMADSLSKW